jgi:nitrogen fixation protein NifU and related proteins
MLPNSTSRTELPGNRDLANERSAQGSLESLYGPIVVDHINSPRNVGVLDHATGVGTVDDAETENLIIVYVRVTQGRIESASFRALACSACIAATSIATVLLTNRRVDDTPITTDLLLDELGGLPEEKRHCAELAARAANLALGHS